MGLPAAPAAAPHWSLAQRIAFRFVFLYLLLYLLPFPIDALPVTYEEKDHPLLYEWLTKPYETVAAWTTKPYEKAMDVAVLWTGQHVFGLDITIRPAGSGDTTWNYVQIFGLAVVSAALTLVWSLLDRRRPSYPRLHEWLRVYVRFALALIMFSYGLAKIIKTQFPTPEASSLLASYGESSPMRLLWTFMGASEPYNWFTGASETIGGLLLLTRRTTLLGALVTFGVMLHVLVLNFCYDVPVKLYSMHLAFMAIFLMAPDLPWLTRVFVLGRSEVPRPVTALTRWPWVNGALVVARTVFVAASLWQGLDAAWRLRTTTGDLASRPELGGLWEVEEFEADGQIRPPLTTDAARWREVAIGRRSLSGEYFSPVMMTGVRSFYGATIDPDKRTITLTRPGPPGGATATALPTVMELMYTPMDGGVVMLEGTLESRRIRAKLRRVDESEFELLTRGFRWINELPFNAVVPRGVKRSANAAAR